MSHLNERTGTESKNVNDKTIYRNYCEHFVANDERFDRAKKSKSLGNSDDIADQVTERNDDYSLGIRRANLELKHMSIICSCNSLLLMWS